jgi:hypothetical protein
MKMENLPILDEKDLFIHREPNVVLEEAKKAAKALGEVIAGKKKPVIINGEQYLEFEDWMTVARFYGITAKVTSTNPISFGEVQGFEARAVSILVLTGEEISAAEAMCLNDEVNWKNRPLFMLRSMAQTRACAKTLRNVLAWVVVLAGYKPTPAEEMEGVKQPIQHPQEKKSESPKKDTELLVTGISSVTQKDGVGKDKKPFTIYTIHVGEERYSTFDKKIAEEAKRVSQGGLEANIEYRTTTYGREIVSLIVEEPGGNQNAQ